MKYRLLWIAGFAGLQMHLAGLAIDLYLHTHDSGGRSKEGLFELSNPGHLLAVTGFAVLAVAVVGIALVWAHDHGFQGSPRPRRIVGAAALPALVLTAAASIWVVSLAQDETHNPALPPPERHVLAFPEPTAVPAAADDGHAQDHEHTTADAEAAAMTESSAHTHGTEVPISPAQLEAAAAFYASVKTTAAEYQDVRTAMNNGYIQITQDLPGIAAHFVNLKYNKDGDLMNPEHPEILLYTKRLDGQWRLVGAMFTSEKASETPPSFFGGLDVWHRHENLCFQAGGIVSVRASAAQCPGVFQAVGAWNLHVWTVEDVTGVFAHDYPAISPGAFPGATRPASADLVAAR